MLSNVDKKSFHNLKIMYLIDLSNNALETIPKNTFYNVTKIHNLNIGNNPLTVISQNMFSKLDVSNIISTRFEICCISPKGTSCSASKPWYISCSILLLNNTMKVAFVCICLTIVLLNIFSASRYLSNRENRKQGGFRIIAFSINCADLLCGIYLGILSVADFYYDRNFIVSHYQWKFSIFCSQAFVINLLFILLVPYFLSLLSLARLMVVKYPFNSRFREVSFVFKCIFVVSISIITTSLSFLMIIRTGQRIPSNLCSPFIDPTDTVTEIKSITLLVALIQVIAFLFISTIYFFLIKTLRQTEEINLTKANKINKNVIFQFLLVTVTNLIGWFPSSMIFVSSLFLGKYPTDLLIWTTVTVVPINSIINPFVFLVFGLKSKPHAHSTSYGHSREI